MLLGNEDATFRSAGAYAVGQLSVAVSDFSGDGKLDLAVASRVFHKPTDYRLRVLLLGHGDGYSNWSDPLTPRTGSR